MRPTESGFSLIEVLAALSLLFLMLISTTPVFLLAARINSAAEDRTFASALANEKAEQLKSAPLASLGSGTDVLYRGVIAYDRAWVVADDAPHPTMRTVTVTVTPRRAGQGGSRAASNRFYRVL